MKLGPITPVLRIFDDTKAREFYLDFLGFTLDWTHRIEADLPIYMRVSRGDCVLHLSAHHGSGTPGSALRIETDDLHAYHGELTAKRYSYARPGIESMPWGSSDMAVIDPFGNQLTFTTPSSHGSQHV